MDYALFLPLMMIWWVLYDIRDSLRTIASHLPEQHTQDEVK